MRILKNIWNGDRKENIKIIIECIYKNKVYIK